MGQRECRAIRDGLLDDPEDFLWGTVINLALDAEKGLPGSATRRFDFIETGNLTSSGGPVYQPITSSNLINGFLEVYYLPWGLDSGYYVILEPDDGPDIMFTAGLTGCAVGYIRANDGAVRVSHHNIQGEDGTDDRAQRRSLHFAQGSIHKSQYRHGTAGDDGEFYVKSEGIAFVFGVRDNHYWRLFGQHVTTSSRQSLRTGASTAKITITDVVEL